MTNPGAGRFSEAHWRKLYEAAVLELDTAKLPDRIEEAKKEIETRLAELTSSAQNSEWEPLIDAHNILDDLLRMHNARKPRPHEEQH
jgi:hypothetical protein